MGLEKPLHIQKLSSGNLLGQNAICFLAKVRGWPRRVRRPPDSFGFRAHFSRKMRVSFNNVTPDIARRTPSRNIRGISVYWRAIRTTFLAKKSVNSTEE
jgi:hypothetical protein